MPQTTINRRCGCKGSDEGVWVVHCGASVVKPGDCKVTTDCKGTCSPTGKFINRKIFALRKKGQYYVHECIIKVITRIMSCVINWCNEL